MTATFVGAFALMSLGSPSEALARHCGYGGGYGGYSAGYGGGYGGGYYSSGYRGVYRTPAIVVGSPANFGYGGYGAYSRGGFYSPYGVSYRGRGVSLSFGF